jgi:putative ATP-binding cassette transporter
MVWMAILYAIIGTYITFKIGNPLIKLNYQQQKYEADFRYNLVRVREYAEQVASYSGEEVEHKVVTRDFDNIVDNFMASVRRNLKINLFNYGYGQLSTIMPTIISAGRYFSKQITLGDMMQINSAFMRVEYSIAYFIYIYSDIANLRSIMNRLHGFNKMIAEINATQMVRINHNQDYYLKIDDLQIETPDKRILIESFSMQADRGDRVLIQGNSGIGKSTLLRTLNRLWPYASGNIYYKPGLKSLFISQKPYLPKVNLKEAICYPKAHNLPSDNQVSEILIQCKLASLVPQLYLIHDWGNHLSLGEQQKLIFARIIINRPDIIYLDEVTSSLDERSEAELYLLLNKVLPNSLIISIGHKSSLTQFHNQVINL